VNLDELTAQTLDDMKRMEKQWDRNLYVDEAVHDYRLPPGRYKELRKLGKLHMLGVGVGAYFEKEGGYEETDTYRILDLTGICFFNDLNNHGINGKKKNEKGRLTGYWKILGTYSHGLILSVIDRLSKIGLEPERVWVCMQTYKYMTIADKHQHLGIRPVVYEKEEHAEEDETLIETRTPPANLSPEDIKMVPDASIKKQRIGKMMRNILQKRFVFDSDIIHRAADGEVIEITRGESINTVPFWDLTMTEQQQEKYVRGVAELYSIKPK